MNKWSLIGLVLLGVSFLGSVFAASYSLNPSASDVQIGAYRYNEFQPTIYQKREEKPLATNRIRRPYAYNDPRFFPEYRARFFDRDYEPNYDASEYQSLIRSLRRRELRRASYDDARPYSIYSRDYTRDYYDAAPDNEVAANSLTSNQYAEPSYYYTTSRRVRYPTGLRYWSYLRQKDEQLNTTQYDNVHYRSTTSTRTTTPSRVTNRTTTTSPTTSTRYRSIQNYRRGYSRYRQPTTRSVGSRYHSAEEENDFAQAVVSVRPLTIDRDFVNGQVSKTPVFQVGFRNSSPRSSTTLPPVYELKKLRFTLQDREGVFADYDDFFLEVNDDQVYFDQDGDITITFNRLRASAGESESFDVYFGIRGDNLLPRRQGSLRLVIEDAEVVREYTSRPANYQWSGNRSSNFISFFPFLDGTGAGDGSVSGNTSTLIFGQNLAEGAIEKVLAVRLGADNSDSVSVRSITVRDTMSNGSIDSWSRRLDMILEPTGRILGSSRFTGGRARFELNPGLVINRGSQIVLSFRIHLSSTIRTNTQNTSFKLMIDANDIDAYSYSTGRDVTSKIVDIDSETFTVSSASGSVGSSASQPVFAAIGSPIPMYRFQLSNPSNGYISVGRITIDTNVVNADYAGGSISTDDFRLKQFVGGRDRDVGFSPTSVSGNAVTFDHSSELVIPPGATFTFTLSAAFENGGDNPYAVFRVLGDSSYQTGTLSQVRASGANFIWSDNSASPHSTGSADWINGYRFNGVPTSSQVVR